MRWMLAAPVAGLVLLLPPTADASAELDALRRELADARAALDSLRRDHEARLLDLESRLAALGGAAAAAPRTPDAGLEAEMSEALASSAPAPPAGGGGRYRLLDVSLSGLFAAGTSTATNDVVERLQGGGHDPHERGFTVQNVELSLAGAVDPYLRGEAHVIFLLDQDGETVVELEEAFVTTQSLPHGLQLKAGHYFTEFGRLNPQHPHQWQFVDQPVVNTRFLGGDGLRGPGARLSWLAPAPWYSELLVGVQRATGETAASFLSSEGEDVAGHPIGAREVHGLEDLLWSARWLNSVALSGSSTLSLGVSAALGPNGTGDEADTRIAGFDAYFKWQPPANERGWPFVAWQTEIMRRDYEAGRFVDDLGNPVAAEDLADWGATTQVTWGLRPRWTLGWRYDWARGERGIASDARLDPLRDRRQRFATALTWYPTEFSKLRLQHGWDRAEFLGAGAPSDEHSVWIQWEFNVGAHGAHAF